MTWQALFRAGGSFGARFNLVSAVPTAFLAGFVIALAWSGAPGTEPSWQHLLRTARNLTLGEAVLLVLLVLFASLFGQPLQRPLVRLLEGYWAERPGLPVVLWRAARHCQYRRFVQLERIASPKADQEPRPTGVDRAYLHHLRRNGQDDAEAAWFIKEWKAVGEERAFRAAGWKRSRFPRPERLLPTALGNALRAAEDSAAQRYGLDTVTMWPALHAVLAPQVREAVDDQRDQLDFAARLCAVLVLCALVAVCLLWGYWLDLGVLTGLALGAARVAYRAAVLAAEGYGVMIRMAFDLQRFDLLTALHLPLPDDSAEEWEANRLLTARLTLDPQLLLRYRHPAG
ncbi:hypothetical protein [Actinomadura gamaensis]|uniref:Uncharacterized protein n=1 Tax=Actinomadura gamaensis TaxID=1763541 RepID=A0ABV9TU93_9ACTN